MGQKTNPIGLRLGINRTWDSRWVASHREYSSLLANDIAVRSFLVDKLGRAAAVSRIVIERVGKKAVINIHSARPGVIIGKKGADIGSLKNGLAKIMPGVDISINLVEVRRAETDARLVAESIAQQLEKRISFKRAMKRAVFVALKSGAKGIRVNCAGRLGGAEIARTEWYREGRVPLHTLRSNIDYASVDVRTPYGICGIKVWIYKGDILEHDPMALDKMFSDSAVRTV